MSARPALAVVPVSDLRSWRDGVESLSPAKLPYPGFYGEAWQKAHANMLDFPGRFGAQAHDLGWNDLDLFGVHPVIGTGRVDHCGALTLATKPAEWTDAVRVNFGNTTYYRNKPGIPRGVPI